MQPRSLPPGAYFGRAEGRRRVGALSLCRTNHAARTTTPLHAHGETYVCLALAGRFHESTRREEREVEPGSILFHPSGEVHADRFGDAPVACLNLALAPEWSEGLAEPLARAGRSLHVPAEGAVGLAWRLAREYEEADEESALAIEGLTLELLAVLRRDARRPAAEARPRWLAPTVERLRAELELRLSLSELARDAGVHGSTLARHFRRHLGCSMGEYRRRARLERACAELRASEAPLADVARRAGYADQSHLTRALRAATGLSPAAYRRARRGR